MNIWTFLCKYDYRYMIQIQLFQQLLTHAKIFLFSCFCMLTKAFRHQLFWESTSVLAKSAQLSLHTVSIAVSSQYWLCPTIVQAFLKRLVFDTRGNWRISHQANYVYLVLCNLLQLFLMTDQLLEYLGVIIQQSSKSASFACW